MNWQAYLEAGTIAMAANGPDAALQLFNRGCQNHHSQSPALPLQREVVGQPRTIVAQLDAKPALPVRHGVQRQDRR